MSNKSGDIWAKRILAEFSGSHYRRRASSEEIGAHTAAVSIACMARCDPHFSRVSREVV